MIAYHYTSGACAAAIIASGAILPATANVPAHEVPVTWFSCHRTWEPTASKGVIAPGSTLARTATFPEMVRFGIARFAVDAAGLLSWPQLWPAACMTEATAQALARAAHKQDANPRDWLGALAAVPLRRVLRVETYGKNGWQPMECAA